MKTLTTRQCLLLAILLLPLSVLAAENSAGDERADNRTQRNSFQDNSVNNLTSQQPQISQQSQVSRRQAMNIASGRYEGRVLGVVQLDNDNWRVRMDRDGTVFNVFVNASSGDVSASSD